MLVLSRRTNESIVIDGEIVVTVLGVDRGGQVRLGIEAPKRVRILRQELLDQIRAENREALANATAMDALAQLGLRRPGESS
ncbi:MAG: carbon storage regulator CsrA [Planctomycetota bacterium]|jgi:carbon storage regulator|nr:carbon storage regulator CsrA [Planctomycetota bacterium]